MGWGSGFNACVYRSHSLTQLHLLVLIIRDGPQGFILEPRTQDERAAGSASRSKSSDAPVPPTEQQQRPQQRPRTLTLESLTSHTPFEDEAVRYCAVTMPLLPSETQALRLTRFCTFTDDGPYDLSRRRGSF
jgi:hypothetical protein